MSYWDHKVFLCRRRCIFGEGTALFFGGGYCKSLLKNLWALWRSAYFCLGEGGIQQSPPPPNDGRFGPQFSDPRAHPMRGTLSPIGAPDPTLAPRTPRPSWGRDFAVRLFLHICEKITLETFCFYTLSLIFTKNIATISASQF